MPAILQTINFAQIVTLVVVVGMCFGVSKVIPPGPLHDTLIAMVLALGGTAVVSTRTPSADGGSTKTVNPPQ